MRVLQNTRPRAVGGVSFGPAGEMLVAGGSGGYDVWDLMDSSHAFIPSHDAGYLFGCACDPLGRWAYVSDYRGGFRRLPLDGKGTLPVPGSPHETHVCAFDLTPDGRRLVLSRGGYGSNRVECWEVRPSGAFVAKWSIRDGKPVDPDEDYLLNESIWSVAGVAVSRNGKTVATAELWPNGSSHRLTIRDGATGRSVKELGELATDFQTRLAMSLDGRSLFARDKQVLERWDLKAGRRTGQVAARGRSYFQGLAVHPSGELLLTVSGDGQVRYWDSTTLAPIRALKWGVGKLHSVAFSPDGLLAAAGGDKGQVVVWDVELS